MDANWVVIGIGGATCSGKTTIAQELRNRIPECVLIHQDDFYFPMGSSQLEFIEELQHYNWDNVSAINFDKLVAEIQSVTQTATTEKRIVILDGHLIFTRATIANRCAKKYFVTVAKDTARYRRRTRKYKRYDERYFDMYAWPLYEYYKGQAFDKYRDLIVLDGEKEMTVNVDLILQDVKSMTVRKSPLVVIVEGTLVLNVEEVTKICSLNYYFTLSYEECKRRRSEHTYEFPDPPFNFDKIVWPQYLKHKNELKNENIRYIDCEKTKMHDVLEIILLDLSKFGLKLQT